MFVQVSHSFWQLICIIFIKKKKFGGIYVKCVTKTKSQFLFKKAFDKLTHNELARIVIAQEIENIFSLKRLQGEFSIAINQFTIFKSSTIQSMPSAENF